MLKSRAVGGRFSTTLESFTDSMCDPGNLVLLVSYTLDQSLKLFRKVKDYVKLFSNLLVRHEGKVYSSMVVNEKMTEVNHLPNPRIG